MDEGLREEGASRSSWDKGLLPRSQLPSLDGLPQVTPEREPREGAPGEGRCDRLLLAGWRGSGGPVRASLQTSG